MWQPHKDAIHIPTSKFSANFNKPTTTTTTTASNIINNARMVSNLPPNLQLPASQHLSSYPSSTVRFHNNNNNNNNSNHEQSPTSDDYLQLLRNKSLLATPWHYANAGHLPAALALLAHTTRSHNLSATAARLSPTTTTAAATTTSALTLNNLLPDWSSSLAATLATLSPLAPFGLGLDVLPIDLLTSFLLRLNTNHLGNINDNNNIDANAFNETLTPATTSMTAAQVATESNIQCSMANRQNMEYNSTIMERRNTRKRNDFSMEEYETLLERERLRDKDENGEQQEDVELLPPPKKKWIRHYLKASQLHITQNGELSPMIVEDGRPISYVAAANGGAHSPPRGNPYLQMISQHQGSTVGQVPHVIGGSGRRRTISSNSNGAGTRETHNKLEKNRRAHLKECYELLRHELPLKDEDRKKTSNLVILGEALKYVQNLKKQQHDLESEADNLGSQKINLQMKLKNLKRELGPKYEQIFGPDTDTGNEREIINDNTSLLSSRGSILYSSSSSLSSGGSNGSNTLSSPIGSGMQTAMPTTISPVITKRNNSTNSSITNTTVAAAAAQFNGNGSTSITMVNASPNSAAHMQQQQHLKASASVSANNSPTGSPTNNTVTLNGVINVNSTPLSLTAKNLTAMSQQTRASPTPSTTPLPSPSSSSCISSSSSSLISSSPPMAPNGVINGRNVMLSIPTSLKLANGSGAGATIGNGTTAAAATIIATSAPGNGGTTNSNNARMNAATTTSNHSSSSNKSNSSLATMTATTTMATIAASAINNAYRNHAPQLAHNRKTGLSISIDETKKHESTGQSHANDTRHYEDGEQPAKFIKVFNGLVTTTGTNDSATKQLPAISMVPLNNGIGQLQLSQVVGGGSLVVSPTYIAAAARSIAAHPQQKLLLNGSSNSHNGNGHDKLVSNSELGRLPGGAELNILPANALNGNSHNSSSGTGLKINGAFYHANGKLTLVNGGISNGIVLKDGANNTAAALTPLIVTTGPSMVATSTNGAGNGMHYTTNFAQLLAANAANNNKNNNNRSDMSNVASNERNNGKRSL